MDITLNCKISLSKKLRALLGSGGRVTLITENLDSGKGIGKLLLSSDNVNTENISGETSIIIEPTEILPEDFNEESSIGNIFSNVPKKGQEDKITRKIAAVNAPEKNEVPHAIKKEIETPKVFKELKNPVCKKWISNAEELMASVNKVKAKKSEVDLSSIQNDRERAILMEIKEKEEAIEGEAWIVNDQYGIININDLNISLLMNSPFNLANISAKRIAASRDFRDLLRSGQIKLISPEQKDEYIMKIAGTELTGHDLPVFDNLEKAMDNMGSSVSENPVIDDENAMEVSGEELDLPTEQESEIINLTQDMPSRKSSPQSRHTIHKNVFHKPANPNIKSVQKKF